MRAKECITDYSEEIFYLEDTERVIYDLRVIRSDKEATQKYYENILISDIRYEKLKSNESKLPDYKSKAIEMLHAEYLDINPEFTLEAVKFIRENETEKYLDSIFVYKQGEIGRKIAQKFREQLSKIVEQDKTFGYILYFLSGGQDRIPNQQEIEKAIFQETTEELKIAEKRIFELEQQLRHENEYVKEIKAIENFESIKSKYRIVKDKKTDFIKIISTMYDCLLFETQDGFFAKSKQDLFNVLGKLFDEDFKNYSVLLSNSKNTGNFLEVFDKLKEKANVYYTKDDNRKKQGK